MNISVLFTSSVSHLMFFWSKQMLCGKPCFPVNKMCSKREFKESLVAITGNLKMNWCKIKECYKTQLQYNSVRTTQVFSTGPEGYKFWQNKISLIWKKKKYRIYCVSEKNSESTRICYGTTLPKMPRTYQQSPEKQRQSAAKCLIIYLYYFKFCVMASHSFVSQMRARASFIY